MSKFFEPNIGRAGRIARGILGVVLLFCGLILIRTHLWIGLVLIGSGVVGLFEAFRGWCLMRACGFKTRL